LARKPSMAASFVMPKIKSIKILVAIGIIAVIFLPPFVKYLELRYKNARLAQEIATLREENRKLGEEKRRLETDITYIEERAREKMGVARKGEIVIKEAPRKK